MMSMSSSSSPLVTVNSILELLETVTSPPEMLQNLIESTRKDMESPGLNRTFMGGNQDTKNSWRGKPAPPSYTQKPIQTLSQKSTHVRYQSQFKSSSSVNMNDKILNTILGNKLNAFTKLTYNDTRDFIYQIMDSGETSFIKDFIEKVFMKATLEELYCGLFAKLIAEIAHRYPVMYDEMNKYHTKFLDIFDDVEDHKESEYDIQVRKKQYRMGYGHFISELAGQNALPKEKLIEMINIIGQKLRLYIDNPGKIKTIEEFIDCLFRLTNNLKEKSPAFFSNVKHELISVLNPYLNEILAEKKAGLSTKGRFGLLDLKDLFV